MMSLIPMALGWDGLGWNGMDGSIVHGLAMHVNSAMVYVHLKCLPLPSEKKYQRVKGSSESDRNSSMSPARVKK